MSSLKSNEVEISRENYPWGRAYIVKGVDEAPLILPSVTTILKLVKIEKYEKLKEEFGEQKWNKIMSDASERGNILHKMLEIFLMEWAKERDVERSLKKAQIFAIEESRKEDGKYAKIVERGRNLFWNFYHDKFWENISEIVDNEVFLFTAFKGGWAGTTDFVYLDMEENLIVDDFKSATFAKDEDDILAYKLQIVAYMFMCAEKYGKIPKMGRIRISNENTDQLQTFIVHDWEMKEYLKKFLELLAQFKEIYGI
jgi:hypothetical protein